MRSPAFILRSYAVLIRLSPGYPPLQDTFRCLTHPFATRRQAEARAAVRLACVRHAASVQSEPGSNSSVQTCYCFRFSYEPVAHSKSLTKDLIAQTFLNYFLCETRLLSLLRQSRRTTARPTSSTHTYRLLVFKEHPQEAPCLHRVAASAAEKGNYEEPFSFRQQVF